MDNYIRNLLNTINSVQRAVAANIKSTSQKVDQRLNANLRYTEWDTGDKVLFRYYSEKHHPLSPWWVGPVLIINKASPTTYLVEIKVGRKKLQKWFHSTQLKSWRGRNENQDSPKDDGRAP